MNLTMHAKLYNQYLQVIIPNIYNINNMYIICFLMMNNKEMLN